MCMNVYNYVMSECTMYRSLVKEAHYGLSTHPQFSPNFLLRSKAYLKERPPSASREFPLSSKPEDVVNTVQTTQLHGGLL